MPKPFDVATSDWTLQLGAWHDVYMLAGTAAATLMGLTFVVVTLSPRDIGESLMTGVKSFTTPILAFFATVVLVSLLMLAPWLTPRPPAATLGILGLIGVFYMISTGAYARWRESKLGFDDLIWYIVLPFIAYTALVPVAVFMWMGAAWALYGIASVVVLLLIIGIRNAWDVVLFMAIQTREKSE